MCLGITGVDSSKLLDEFLIPGAWDAAEWVDTNTGIEVIKERPLFDVAESLRMLTGTRPGILAMFIEDTDRNEWRLLRDRLDLEGEARQFLTNREARPVVAVTCSSRVELFGIGKPDGAGDGELRFRNPAHPAAKLAALAAAVQSSS